MRDLLLPINRPYLVKSSDGGRETSVNTEDLERGRDKKNISIKKQQNTACVLSLYMDGWNVILWKAAPTWYKRTTMANRIKHLSTTIITGACQHHETNTHIPSHPRWLRGWDSQISQCSISKHLLSHTSSYTHHRIHTPISKQQAKK